MAKYSRYQIGDVVEIDGGVGIIIPGGHTGSEDYIFRVRIRAPEKIRVHTVSSLEYGILIRTTDYDKAEKVWKENSRVTGHGVSDGTLQWLTHYYRSSTVCEYIGRLEIPFIYTPGKGCAPPIIRRTLSWIPHPLPEEDQFILPQDILEQFDLAGNDTGGDTEFISDMSSAVGYVRRLFPRDLNEKEVQKVEIFPLHAAVFFANGSQAHFAIDHPQRLIDYCRQHDINVIDATMPP